MLNNFGFTGKVVEKLDKHGHHEFADNIEEGGITFPQSRKYWAEISTLTPVEALKYLKAESQKKSNIGEINLCGLKIPSKSVALLAPIIVLASLLYSLAHLTHLARNKSSMADVIDVFGWVVLFPDRISKAIVFFAFLVIPVLALLLLTVNTWSSLSISLRVFSMIGVLVVLIVSTRCVYEISLLRK